MNKKLIKTIASITCGLGIVATIPFAATSCGCSTKKNNSLPAEVYEIDDNNVLQGFKSDFLNNPDSEIYQDNFKDYDTMLIPAKVTSIASFAFYNNSAPTIPSFITKLVFPKKSNCSLINSYAFQVCSSLTSITFPSSLTTIKESAFQLCSSLTSVTFPYGLEVIGPLAFCNCSSLTSIIFPSSLSDITNPFVNCTNLTSITWDGWNGNTSLQSGSFSTIAEKGEVKVTNPIDDAHNSAVLLATLKQKAGLPEGWTAHN